MGTPHLHNCEYQELRVCSFPLLAGETIKSGKAHALAWQGTLGACASSTLNVGTTARCIKKASVTAPFKAPSTNGETESGGDNNLTNVLCTLPRESHNYGIQAPSPLNKGKLE